MTTRNRFIFWGVIGCLLFLALAYAFWPRPHEVDTAQIGRGAITVTVEEEGETRVRDLFVMSAPIGGSLERVVLKAGDHVKAGQTLLAVIRALNSPFLDPRTEAQLKAGVDASRAGVAVAEADLKRLRSENAFAQAEFERAEKLLASGTMPRTVFEQIEAQARSRAASYQAALAALKMRRSEFQMAVAALRPSEAAAEDCECVHIMSAVDGVILRVLRESEGPVSQGMGLMEIGDPARLEVVAELLSEDAVKVRTGQRVIVSGWGGDELSGRVRLVEPFAFTKVSALGIEEQRVNVVMDIDPPNTSGGELGHGYRADVAIVISEADDVLLAPLTSLFRSGENWAVFILERGRAQLKLVQVGRMNAEYAEVLSGVPEGAFVIVHPPNSISDGVRVRSR